MITFIKALKISTPKFVLVLAGLLLAAPTVSFANSSKDSHGVVDPAKCGGIGQPSCELSAAKYHGKTKRSKPQSRAFTDPRKGGEWWVCPDNRPRRTLNKVTGSKACARKSVTSPKSVKAKYLAKTHTSKPNSRAFKDLRKGGEWWSCPSGFWRNANKVTGKAACTVDVGGNCDRGNIAIGGSLLKGENITDYTCYKRLDCGKEHGRPCQLTERIPSCNKRLAEDFITNTCINAKLAACLTGVRTIRYTVKAAEGLSGVEKEISKAVKKMSDALMKIIPGLKEVVGAIDKEAMKLATKAQKLATDNVEKMLSKVKVFKKIETTMKTLATSVRKNEKKIQKLLTSDNFCTMQSHERASSMAKLLGTDLRNVDLAENSPGILDGLLIKSAHAASNPTSFLVGISAGPTKNHVNLGLALDYVFDASGKSAFYLGASIGATTGSDSAMDVSLNIGIMPNTAYNGAAGSSISIGIGGDLGLGEEVSSVSSDISMNLNWKNKKHPVSFGGISLGFSEGGDTSSLDFSASFSQSVLIVDLK